MIHVNPQPSVTTFSHSLLGPACQMRKANKPALIATARTRSGRRAFGGILNTGTGLRERIPAEGTVKDVLGVNQGLGTIDVVPMGMADIKGPEFLFSRELAHAIRQRAVSITLCRFKPVEQCRAAQKHSCIECVITGKVFANFYDMAPFASDLGCVVQVKDIIQLAIDREDDFVSCEWLLQQRLGGFWFENVVGHEQ